jgi:hypothetical protein
LKPKLLSILNNFLVHLSIETTESFLLKVTLNVNLEKIEAAQIEKEVLENLQRKDRKLRQSNKASNH